MTLSFVNMKKINLMMCAKKDKGGGMMDRLTENVFGCYQIKGCGNFTCKETCDNVLNCRYCPISEAINKLAEYEDLEDQGLLLKLPCKVGNTIYVNGILGVGEAEEYKVIRVDYHSNLAMGRSEFYMEALLVNAPENSIGFYDKEIGKTVFLTQAEAEQKLKEMESENNDRL